MERELRFVVDENLERLMDNDMSDVERDENRDPHICHELLACNSDLLGQCCAKHHDLFVVRCHSKNFLNISAHV